MDHSSSFAVRDDMISHPGALLTIKQGGLKLFPATQKTNRKSSTVSKVLRVDDAMPI